MADVTRLRDGRGEADRGQLLAITGLLIAITLVLLAVLLNGVIYAENLSTRGSDVGGRDAAAFERAVESVGTERLVEINDEIRDDDSYDRDNGTDDLEDDIDAWAPQAHAHVIRDGVYTDVSLEDTTEGTRIFQAGNSSFVDKDDDDEWTLAEDVRVRDYVLEAEFDDGLISSDPFLIIVSGNDNTWELSINYEDFASFTGIEVEAEMPDGNTEVCEGSGGVTIDFVNQTVDFADGNESGDLCDAAVFADGVEPPYDIEYDSGDNVEGTYSLVVNKTEDDLDGDHYDDDDSDSPSREPAIYSADVGVTYETDRIEYESTLEVVPGEIDDD